MVFEIGAIAMLARAKIGRAYDAVDDLKLFHKGEFVNSFFD